MERDTLKTFVVVAFIEEDSVGIVPATWIISNNLAMWPEHMGTKTLNHAIKTSIPWEECWEKYRIKILYSCDDYLKARKKSREAEELSELEDTDMEIINTRRRRHPLRYEEDTESTPTKKSATPKQFKLLTQQQYPSPYKKLDRSSGSTPTTSKKTKSIKSFSPVAEPLERVKTFQHSVRQPFAQLDFNNENQVLSSPSASSSPSQITAVQKKSISLLVEIKAKMDHLERKIDGIQHSNNRHSKAQMQWPDELPKLPLTSTALARRMEARLHENKKNRDILISHLGSIGGQDLKATVNGILSRFFGIDLQKNLNWLGRGGEQKLGLSTGLPNLLDVIFRAVRQNEGQATEHEIKKKIQCYLKYASDREGGRKKRKEKPEQQKD